MKILLAKQKWPILEKELQTDIKRGLTSQQVQYKKNLYGKNKLKNNIQTSIWYKIKHQINNFLVLILMIASIVIFIIGFIENSFQELFEGVLILAIIFINVLLGVFYEYKVEKAVSFINQKTLPYMKVLRDDQIQLIVIEDIVIGDIVFLEIGDVVPADLRIIEANNLQMEESILTGENTLVTKNNLVDDNENNLLNCCNLVFKDTVVFYGKAKGVVIAVGMDTEIGKIMTLVKNIKISATPLEKNMNQLGKFLTVWILFLIMFNTLIVFVKHYYVHQIINFLFFKKIFLISVSLAVAVIPEGILTIITIILILSMKKLLNKKTIVKNIYALETLSTVQVICTDKTGTLTKNQLNIVNICFYQQSYDVQNNIFFNNLLHKILKYGILCSNINVNFQKQTSLYKNNPIDQSFLNLSLLLNYNVFDIINKNAKILEIPFDSDRKLMTTVHQNQENYLIITKGAPEILFSICKYIDDNGNILSKNNCNFNFFENYLEKMSQQSLRVIGIAYKKINSKRIIKDDLRKEKIEKDLIFLGLVSFQDLIKPEAFATIDIFQKAHIKPIMITGDNSNTALAVAKKLNIFNDKTDFVVNGDVVEKMTEKELNSKLDFITVYARITPINKLKIINAWQKKGFIIAMIGDGVNDAPSLKKADIGISMGQKGTEISKVASDIIIMDDNLLTITVAIKEGRNIFYSIQKSLIFLMSCNTGELTAILLNTFFNFIFFDNDFILLTSLQILWINLVTDSFIAISLGINAKEDSVMLKTSRNLNEKIIDQKIFFKIILGGLIIGFVTFLSAIIGFSFSKYKNLEYLQRQKYAQTFAFMVLSLSQLFHVFNLINFKKSVFVIKPSINLITIFILSFLFQFLTIKMDFLKNIFHLVNLNFLDILLILLLSMIPFIILDISKKFHYIK